jgi:hypothetical protein
MGNDAMLPVRGAGRETGASLSCIRHFRSLTRLSRKPCCKPAMRSTVPPTALSKTCRPATRSSILPPRPTPREARLSPCKCTGPKNATCLSPAQIQAVKKINQCPRNSGGQQIAVAEDHVTNIAQGYVWDGGWMTTVGVIPGVDDRDLNLFCASENLVTIAESLQHIEPSTRRALLAACEPVMTYNHRGVIGDITHSPYQCREAVMSRRGKDARIVAIFAKRPGPAS